MEHDDPERVPQAAVYLVDDALDAYVREQESITTWEDFTTFLWNTIKDPMTRISDATGRSQYLRQREGQSVRELRETLEQAEKEVEAAKLSKEQLKAWRFLHALRPEIKTAVLGDAEEVRKSRDTIYTAAIRHEALLKEKKGKERESPPESSSQPHKVAIRKADATAPTERPHREPTSAQASSEERGSAPVTAGQSSTTHPKGARFSGSCNNCGKRGHKARDCRNGERSGK